MSNVVPTAATLVVTYETLRGRRVILTRRPATMRRHPGQVAFPGGMIESTDATPFAAAAREAWEEIRLRLPTRIVPVALTPVRTRSSGIIIQPYWVQLPTGPRLVPAPSEVEAILRIPLRDLCEPTALQAIPHPRRPEERTPACVWRGEVIWGATLQTLRELLSLRGN